MATRTIFLPRGTPILHRWRVVCTTSCGRISAIRLTYRSLLMTFTRARAFLVALLLTSAACAMSSALIASPVPQEDEAAIKQLVTNFGNTFSSHDAHAVAQLFTAEADYTTGG